MGLAKSIVVVTVDCLRADHVGFMGYPGPTTPFLDSLAAESFVVPQAIAAGAPTYYSFPAIMASRYPLSLGRDVLGLAPGEANLASVLKQAGYATALFNADNPFIGSEFGYADGLDTFPDFPPVAPARSPAVRRAASPGWLTGFNQNLHTAASRWSPVKTIYDELYFQYCQRRAAHADSVEQLRPYRAADDIVGQACTWLKSIGDTPFFLWLHLMDPHWPYYPPVQALELMGRKGISASDMRYLNSWWNRSDLGPARLSSHRDDVIALYDAGIRWVDVQIEHLIQALRGSDKWNDCIFALTADHGEEFLDHGGRFHPPGVMEELIHVPLLLRVPGAPKKPVANSPFSLLHLAPTLLAAAELPSPAEFRGSSYWDQIREGENFDGLAISECIAGCTNPSLMENRMKPRRLSVRSSRFKLVLRFDVPDEQLFDLVSDPGEQAPLGQTAQKAVRRELLEAAHRHLRNSSGGADQKAVVRARLREHQLEWSRSSPQSQEAVPAGSRIA